MNILRKEVLYLILNTKDFQQVASKILGAVGVDRSQLRCLDLVMCDDTLAMMVGGAEFSIEANFPVDNTEEEYFKVAVDALTFLDLIKSIDTETFSLTADTSKVTIKINNSKYTIAVVYAEQSTINTKIKMANPTSSFVLTQDIINSIINVNSKDVSKNKFMGASELSNLYYLSNLGCFNFAASSACLNRFNLANVKILLTDRLVKLLKLFKGDANCNIGHTIQAGSSQVLTTLECYDDIINIKAILVDDTTLLTRFEKDCLKAQRLIEDTYPNCLSIKLVTLQNIITRMMGFQKNTIQASNKIATVTCELVGNSLKISDKFENAEYVVLENNSTVEDSAFVFNLNLAELQAVLDTCKTPYINLLCGNPQSIVINRGPVSTLLGLVQ